MAANVAVEPSEFGVVTGVPLSEADTLSIVPPSEELFAIADDAIELMTIAALDAAIDDDDNVGALEVSVADVAAVVGEIAVEDGVAVVTKVVVAAVLPPTVPPTLDNDDNVVVFVVVKDDELDCDGDEVSLFTLKAAAATAAALLKPKLGTNSAAFTFKVENFVAISALS